MFMKPVKMFSCLSRYTTKLYFHPKQNFRDFFLVIEEIIVFAFDFQKLSSIIVFLKMYLLQKISNYLKSEVTAIICNFRSCISYRYTNPSHLGILCFYSLVLRVRTMLLSFWAFQMFFKTELSFHFNILILSQNRNSNF